MRRLICFFFSLQIEETDEHFVRELKEKFNQYKKKILPDNHDKPFSPFSAITTKEVADQLNEVFTMGDVRDATVDKILAVFQKALPNIDMFTKPQMRLKDYREDDERHYEVHVCKKGCMAFHGADAKLIRCKKCNTPRFTKCKYCKGKPYESCSPFCISRGRIDVHALATRVPLSVAYFRSIILKLLECFQDAEATPDLFSYHDPNNRFTRDGHTIDICDGEEIKRQQEIMRERYVEKDKTFEVDGIKRKLVEFSLILTLFYDGKVNYKRKLDSMWPLLLSIINCNPSLRSRLGVGLFLVLLHNLQGSSAAEKYLMEEILIKELQALEKGIVFAARRENGEEIYVFLQARLVFLHLDTRALEPTLGVQSANAIDACPCCHWGKGVNHASIGRTVYKHTRDRLDPNHHLRFFGQNCEFCKVEQAELFANKEKWAKDLARINAEGRMLNNVATETGTLPRPKYSPPSACDEPRVWYNNLFPLEMFQHQLWYEYWDTRDQTIYMRKDHKEYVLNGNESQVKQAAYDKRALLRTKKAKKPLVVSTNGVHFASPLLTSLEAMTLDNTGFDIMHLVTNCSAYMIDTVRGKRGLKTGTRNYCVGHHIHPVLQYTKIYPPFQAIDTDLYRMDAVCNAIVLPPFYSSEYRMTYPFKRAGNLKSRDHINFTKNYFAYCLTFAKSVDPVYSCFVARYAYDLNCILDPCLSIEELENVIIKNIYETLSIKEGLYPPSEMLFVFHQLICICHSIKRMGHLRGLMCFAGERALSTIAANVTKGGVHYLKTLYHRYTRKERYLSRNQTTANYYLDNSNKFSDFVLRLLGPPSNDQEMSAGDKKMFFTALCEFLESQQSERNIHTSELFRKSPMYRLWKAYENAKMDETHTTGEAESSANQPKYLASDFWTWIVDLEAINMRGALTAVATEDVPACEDLTGPASFWYIAMANDRDKGVELFLADFLLLKQDIIAFDPTRYHKAIIKGITFKCRPKFYLAQNDLKVHWADKHLSATWCRYVKVTRGVNYVKVMRPVVAEKESIEQVERKHGVEENSKVSEIIQPEMQISTTGTKRKREDLVEHLQNNAPSSSTAAATTAPPLRQTNRASVPSHLARDYLLTGNSTTKPPAHKPRAEKIVHQQRIRKQNMAPLKQAHQLPTPRAKPPGDPKKESRRVKSTEYDVVPESCLRTTTRYGHLDYTFRLKLSGDPVVDGLAFAHVSTRKTVSHKKDSDSRWHASVHCFTSATASTALSASFVCLHNVCSTAIAVSAIDGYNKPILAPHSRENFSQTDGDMKRYFSDPQKRDNLAKLYLLELHPERLKFQYTNILRDEENVVTHADATELSS